MIKFFRRNYTIRFTIINHLVTPDYLAKKINDFCSEKNLNLKALSITNSIKTDSNSGATLIESSFVQINGSKKDFEILKNFLHEFHDARTIVIMTV